jgi:hypothetical protein
MQQQVKGRKWTFSSISRTSEAPIDEERVGPSQVDKCVLALVVSVVTIAAVAIGVVMSGRNEETTDVNSFALRPIDHKSTNDRRLSEYDELPWSEFVCSESGRLSTSQIQFSAQLVTEGHKYAGAGITEIAPRLIWDFNITTGDAQWNDPSIDSTFRAANQTSVFDTTDFSSMQEYFDTLRFDSTATDASEQWPACNRNDYIARDSYTCGPAFVFVYYESKMVPNTTSCTGAVTGNIVPSMKRFMLGNFSRGVITVSAPIPHRLLAAELRTETCTANLRLSVGRTVSPEYRNDTLFESVLNESANVTESTSLTYWNLQDPQLWSNPEGWELDRRFPDGEWTFNATGGDGGGMWTSASWINPDDALYDVTTQVGYDDLPPRINRILSRRVKPAILDRLGSLSNNDRSVIASYSSSSIQTALWYFNVYAEVYNANQNFLYHRLFNLRMRDQTVTRPPLINETIWNMSTPTQAELDGGHQSDMCRV